MVDGEISGQSDIRGVLKSLLTNFVSLRKSGKSKLAFSDYGFHSVECVGICRKGRPRWAQACEVSTQSQKTQCIQRTYQIYNK